MNRRKRVKTTKLEEKSPRTGKSSELIHFDDGSYQLVLLDGEYALENLWLGDGYTKVTLSKMK